MNNATITARRRVESINSKINRNCLIILTLRILLISGIIGVLVSPGFLDYTSNFTKGISDMISFILVSITISICSFYIEKYFQYENKRLERILKRK